MRLDDRTLAQRINNYGDKGSPYLIPALSLNKELGLPLIKILEKTVVKRWP